MAKEKWSLEEVTAKYMDASARNTPTEDLDWFVRQHGYTPDSFKIAVDRQGSKDNTIPPETLEQGGGFWNTVMDGVTYFNEATDSLMTGRTFGLSVPARALGRWAKKGLRSTGVVPFMDEQPAEWPLESLAAVQAEDKRFADENPKTAMGTEIAGGITGGMAAEKALTTAVPYLAPVAGAGKMNLVKGVTSGAGIGTVEGGGVEAAKGGGVEGTMLGMMIGGGSGAAGVLLLPAAEWAAKKLASPIRKLFGKTPKKDLTQAEIRGEQMLEEVDQKDSLTVIQKEMKLAEYEKHGLGDEVMEVDLLGKKGQNLAGTIMRHGDKVPDAAETALVERAGRVRQHIYNFLQDATGGTRASQKKAVDTFKKAAKEESAPVYDAAFYNGGKMRTVSDTDLSDLFKMPEFKDAYKRAIYLAKHDTPPVTLAPMPKKGFPEGHQFPVYALDKVKKAIGSKTKGAFSSPDPNARALAGTMTQHKNKMLDIIGESNSDYKQARDIYAGSMEFKDATELGQKLFDSGDSYDKIYEAGNKLKTESEKREFRNAAFNTLSKKIESSSVNPKGMARFFMNKQNMHKLELLIPDAEKRGIFLRQNELLSDFVDVKNKIIGNSQTAEKLAADAAEEEMNQGLRAVSNIVNRNPAGLAIQAQEFGNTARKAARLDEAGKKMYRQTPPKIQADHEGSLVTNKLLKDQMRNRGLLSGGVAGGGASLMNSLLQ